MNRPRRTFRPAFAMLLVLVCLLVVAVTATGLARLAMDAKQETKSDSTWRLAGEVLFAVEPVIEEWLEKSSTVVLAPDVTEPCINVLNDLLLISQETTVAIRITAWDQYGLPSALMLENQPEFRSTLPADVLELIDTFNHEATRRPGGLDEVAAFRRSRDFDAHVFPQRKQPWPPPRLHKSDHIDTLPDVDSFSLDSDRNLGRAIGSHLALHNPGAINVNTASREVLKAALRLAGRSGIEFVEAERDAGRPSNPGRLATTSPPSGEPSVQLVGESRCWAFRIEVTINHMTRSWWAVYQRDRRNWTCIQRYAIPE